MPLWLVCDGAVSNIATYIQILYTFAVEYPFPPVGIVGAADGKNRRAFFFNHRDIHSELINNLLCLRAFVVKSLPE